ncbi:hypothetical protein DFJ77DRAFT_448109 [Powellomyces hirtus]|nr:hypothetical protein DFJ77DRAFT_448109 [Powellomyces hirtus]
MMIPRSRRHSFAEHGETLVAASTAAEQSNNTSTNGSRIDLSGGRPAIKVGDDGRPNPRHLNSTNQAKMSFSGIPRTTTTTKLNANNHSTTTTAILESGATPDFDAASATTTNVSDHHNSPNHNNNNNNNATTTTTHRAASQSLITPSLATYDPYPATWPTRDDVRRARRMVGVEAPEKDEWSRMGVRFGRVRKTKLGPGTYTPLSRGTLDPHSPHAHLSTVPRFPSLPHNPAVGPGSYCVDRVPCTPGFKPWIMTLVPLSWRPPAVAKCGAAGGNALEGDYEDRIEDFAAARRKVLCAQHNTQHPILSDTPLLLPIPSSAKSTPPPPPQQSPTTTTTTTRQGGGGEGGKGMHVFSAAFLVAPPPRPVILLTS